MTLVAGTKLGPYEITGPLGAGGMGEVYRAKDTRLGREVAIKALPEGFERDAERVARFEREARLLASLNHPNIGMLYAIEHHGESLCLALELIEGESLAERLGRGALPMDEAFEVASQVAGALEAAHDAGVVHRDLKPGNIMLRPDGVAKVLDFGLARGPAGAGTPSDLSNSPTMASPATVPGMILGTAAYMSPEQAKGRVADRRADLWAWGCVLFEMLAGRRAFPGDDVSETLASILRSEPDWSALPAGTPPRVHELLARCLRKDARERLRDAGDARLLLAEARAHREPGVAASPRRGLPWGWAAALAALAIGVTAVALLRGSRRELAPATLALMAPSGVTMADEPYETAISPDGRTVVFVGQDTTGVQSLWARSLAREDARPLAGTNFATQPFWSPDSRSIGFFADGKLKTLRLDTGAIDALCDAPLPRGGAWGRGFIVLQPRSVGPLYRIPEQGGALVATTVVDSAAKDRGHRFPSFLPDGRHFLYSILGERRGPGGGEYSYVGMGSLDGGRGVDVGYGSSGAVYAAPGWMIFSRDGALRAQRLDPGTRRASGPALAIPGGAGISPGSGGAPVVSVSATGVLLQRAAEGRARHLEWLDRAGRSLGSVGVPAGYFSRGDISPDGRRVALEYGANSSDPVMIWILDLARETMQRMTFDGSNYGPVWSPDGREIAFSRVLVGATQSLWTLRADTPGSQRLVLELPHVYNTMGQYTPDGRAVIYRTQGTDTQQDIAMAALGDSAAERLLVATRFNELQGSISPDGRWLTYLSDDTGRLELYVRSFPDLGGVQRLSTNGAFGERSGQNSIGRPRWRRDGRELLYVAADGRTVMSMAVTPGNPPAFGAAHPLFKLGPAAADLYPMPDLDRFLVPMVRDEEGRSSAAALVDWRGLLEAAR